LDNEVVCVEINIQFGNGSFCLLDSNH
jgi:hypothetical protein